MLFQQLKEEFTVDLVVKIVQYMTLHHFRKDMAVIQAKREIEREEKALLQMFM